MRALTQDLAEVVKKAVDNFDTTLLKNLIRDVPYNDVWYSMVYYIEREMDRIIDAAETVSGARDFLEFIVENLENIQPFSLVYERSCEFFVS